MTNTSNADAVKARFDLAARDWDANPVRVALARAVADAIRNAVELRPNMEVMDFGAGTGLLTLSLLPYVGNITACDTSSEMVKVLDEKLKSKKINNVQPLLADIGATSLPVSRFDLVVSSMVLHHIPDVPGALKRLQLCLRPGGRIALADLDTEDGSFHTDRTGVFHNGLDRKTVCEWLTEAGFTHTVSREAHRIVRPADNGPAREYPVFLVTGEKV